MNKCFTCGDGMPLNTKQRIEHYKMLYEKTGQNYVYYKLDNGGIGITATKGFKPKKGQEYALVTEFGQKTTTDEQSIINELPVVGAVSVSDMVEDTKQGNRATKRNKSRKAK